MLLPSVAAAVVLAEAAAEAEAEEQGPIQGVEVVTVVTVDMAAAEAADT